MDPISDMLIQIKNAACAGLPAVTIPFSNIKLAIAKVLEREGYLKAVVKKGKKVKKVLACDLSYDASNKPKITDVKRLSKPSRRVYGGYKELNPMHGEMGVLIISTPKGIMTEREARKAKVGGEVLFKVW